VVAEMGGKDAIIVADDAISKRRRRRGAVGVWISGSEVFGVFARDHRRASLRHDGRQDRRPHGEDQARRSDDQSTNMSAVINEKAFKTINSYIEKGRVKAVAC
jgi:acyl-CoA reductase-like NAD-dependent aldehyde dehydrogenase